MANTRQNSASHAGKKFGKLLALTPFGFNGRHRKYLFVCDCGTFCTKEIRSTISGHVKSCGCFFWETRRIKRTHGMTHTSEYSSWKGMWARCTHKNNPRYQEYKDRAPPAEWKSFEVFYRDMGPKPTPLHSIDRIDNNKPYGPSNCRWATAKEQANNKRVGLRGIPIVFRGAAYPSIRSASAATGLSQDFISKQATRVNPL